MVRNGTWEEADHLCRVADITKRQTRYLTEAGVSTLSKLASLKTARVAGMAPEILFRLKQQARLQKQTATSGLSFYEILSPQPGLGFDKLPLADAGDLFFDFEGDPMYPGGLEYLCGVLWQATSDEDVKSHPTPTPFRVQSRPHQVGSEWTYPGRRRAFHRAGGGGRGRRLCTHMDKAGRGFDQLRFLNR